MQLKVLLIIGMIAGATAPAAAQRQQVTKDSAKSASAIPASARPPRGMCRVWIDGVPAAQQPAATDCQTAIKNRPANAHLIFGDEDSDTSKTKTAGRGRLPPNVKGFTDLKPSAPVLPVRPPLD